MTLLDRKLAPPSHLSTDYSLAQPEVTQLPGGIKLYSFRGLQQEAVKLELVYRSGRWFEPKSGVGHFTVHMLPKGSRKKDSFAIAEALDSLGAHLEINAGFDVVEISLYALRKNLLASLDVVREVLEEPAFDDDEFRLLKEIFLQNLRISNEKTNVVASKEIRKVIFGKSHPYGGSVEEEDVSAVQAADLRTFFRNGFVLHSAYLIGHLSDREIQDVKQAIPRAQGTQEQNAQYAIVPGKSLVIKKPGSVQTSLRLGKVCIRKSENPDYFAAVMFNHILGGYFGSRLMKNIREDKGLTYGIYSAMHHFINESFWVIGAEVNQENSDKVIEEIRIEIKRLQENPVSEDELDVARNYFIGSWQSDNATLFAVAEKVKNRHLWNLSDGYYGNLLSYIREITPGRLLETAKTFRGNELAEVRVG